MSETEQTEFNLDRWAASSSLSKKTLTALKREECDNVAALKLLTPRDVNRMNITVGQARLLRVALRGLGNPIRLDDREEPSKPPPDEESGAVKEVDNPEEILDQAGDELAQLLNVGDEKSEAGATKDDGKKGGQREGHGNGIGYRDPLMMLTVKATSKKALQIINFLPEPVRSRVNRRRRDQFTLSTSSGGGLSLKTEEEGSYYISIDEWGAANMRLAAHMLKLGDISAEKIVYYMAYTTMIYDLAAKYEWSSILEYDSRYRELQAEHGFAWGTDHPHAERYILIPRRQIQPGKGRVGMTGSSRYNNEETSHARPLCRDFIMGRCQFGRSCRYRHDRPAQDEKFKTASKNEKED